MIERVHHQILDVLKYLADTLQAGWKVRLKQVTACVNSYLHSGVKKTPHFVLYGEDNVLPCDILVENPQPVINMDDFESIWKHIYSPILKEIRKFMGASWAKYIDKQHQIANIVCW